MDGNTPLIPSVEKDWRRGLNNLMAIGMSQWWKTSTWWVQSLIWSGITIVMLLGFLMGVPEDDPFSAYLVFSLVIGLFAPIAVVIITMDAIVGEKKSGTAAWILSKPVTPIAFILSKFLSNLIGMLVTMVIMPGTIGLLVIGLVSGSFPSIIGFYAGLLVLCLNITFFLSFSLMLGAIFDQGAAVIGIPLVFQFGQQFFVGMLGEKAIYLPWALSLPIGGVNQSVVSALMTSSPVTSWVPVIVVGALTVIFFTISVTRFAKQEF